jgi:DNA-binding transcriptional MerR regulator
MSEEKVTIKIAMKALGVSEKTIYRYLNNGLLTRIKEGHRTYIPSSEVRSLKQKQTESMSGHFSDNKKVVSGHISVGKESMSGQVSLSADEYKKLIKENEELKQKNLLLLEYKLGADQVKKELEETKQKLQEADAEIARLKKPLLRRIVEQMIKK